MKAKWIVCFASTLVVLTGCQGTGPRFYATRANHAGVTEVTNLTVATTNQINPEWLRPGTNAFTLGPGDRLEIELMGEMAAPTPAVVGPDGKIYFYLLPGLQVWGLTLAQTKALIEQELKGLFRNEPRVSVALRAVESQRVWLLGRFNKPGVYPLSSRLTLLEAIAQAGGPASPAALASLAGGPVVSAGTEEIADLRRSFVIRRGEVLPVDLTRLLREGDMTQNIFLEPDDFVYFPSAIAREIYVLGAVGQPNAVAYKDPMTLVGAIASAGGTIRDAYLSHVAIVRGSLSQPKIAIVDFKEIVRGRAPDVLVEPRDIIYVPFGPYQILNRYIDLILNTFGRTVGANAGTRAVEPGAPPVGPSVPVSISQ